MGSILLMLTTLMTCVGSLFQPHIGIIGYYLLALLGPQYIWFWSFQGIRVSFYIAICALVGVGLAVFTHKLDFDFLKTRINLSVVLLWACIILSYFGGSFVSEHKTEYGLSPGYLFGQTNNIYLFYLCATLAINDIKKARLLGLVLVVTTIYLIYWANLQYFTANWSQFSMGRLKGPQSLDGGSIYRDENAFAMLFVTGIPFIYHYLLQVGSVWGRWCSAAMGIFGLHAIFLTGSRGGLLGLGVTVLVTALQSKRKYLAFLLIPACFFFFQCQAGSTMKQRSETIEKYQADRSAEMRLVAWKGGLRMMMDHPVIGVGLGSFITALPRYIDTSPRVAHNTFIQFAAESGVGAGTAYLLIVSTFLINARRVATWCDGNPDSENIGWIRAMNRAASSSFLGLVVCSVFLSLNNYEIFFFLLVLNNALSICCRLPIRQTNCPGEVLREGTTALAGGNVYSAIPSPGGAASEASISAAPLSGGAGHDN